MRSQYFWILSLRTSERRLFAASKSAMTMGCALIGMLPRPFSSRARVVLRLLQIIYNARKSKERNLMHLSEKSTKQDCHRGEVSKDHELSTISQHLAAPRVTRPRPCYDSVKYGESGVDPMLVQVRADSWWIYCARQQEIRCTIFQNWPV